MLELSETKDPGELRTLPFVSCYVSTQRDENVNIRKPCRSGMDMNPSIMSTNDIRGQALTAVERQWVSLLMHTKSLSETLLVRLVGAIIFERLV